MPIWKAVVGKFAHTYFWHQAFRLDVISERVGLIHSGSWKTLRFSQASLFAFLLFAVNYCLIVGFAPKIYKCFDVFVPRLAVHPVQISLMLFFYHSDRTEGLAEIQYCIFPMIWS